MKTIINILYPDANLTSEDCIEYDVNAQISALQHGVCARKPACVCACAVEIKPGMLRASLMYAFGRAYGLLYGLRLP